jgi:hypothetical protein
VADLSDPVSPLQDAGMQICTSSGCRTDIALHGGWDTHSSALGLQTQQYNRYSNYLLNKGSGYCYTRFVDKETDLDKLTSLEKVNGDTNKTVRKAHAIVYHLCCLSIRPVVVFILRKIRNYFYGEK